MILFADTSALVKLYVTEPASDEVRSRVGSADVVAAAQITYTEMRAAFSSRHRHGDLSAPGLRSAIAAFDDDWRLYLTIPISDAVCREAGNLAEQFALRGYDSVQLACFAYALRRAAHEPIEFLCFDRSLTAAARRWVQARRR